MNKQNSVQWFFDQLISHRYIVVNKTTYGDKVKAKHEILLEQAKAMHKEEVKNAYISGYLDNGYYDGAEEDASKLWEDTYGFAHNSTFGGNNED